MSALQITSSFGRTGGAGENAPSENGGAQASGVSSMVGDWLAAAQEAAEQQRAIATPVRPVLLAAHNGAGASTLARLLDGDDPGVMPADPIGPVLLVARASMVGIVAAKAAVAVHGGRLAAALIVPASPKSAPRVIKQELRILSGAIDLVHVPWVEGLLLKRPADVVPADVAAKDLARVRAALRIDKQGESS